MSEETFGHILESRFRQYGVDSPHARVRFYGSVIRYQSLVALHVETLCKGNVLASATGFIMKVEDAAVLVTNWHVLSGRHTATGQPLHSSGAVPDAIHVRFHSRDLARRSDAIRYHQHMFPIYSGERPLWKQHPAGQDVDVATVLLGGLSDDVLIAPQNTGVMFETEDVVVGSDVFIVGFPASVPTLGHLPIWKRGTIASEALVVDDQIRRFYVDAASREGMSGSPVYSIRQNEVEIHEQTMTGRMGAVVPVGIYSGRVYSSDRLASEIGIIWHTGFIVATVNGGQPGAHVIRKAEEANNGVPPLTPALR